MNTIHYTFIFTFLVSGIFFGSINHWIFAISLIGLPLFLLAYKTKTKKEGLLYTMIVYWLVLFFAISVFGFIFSVICLYCIAFYYIFKK